MHSAWVQSRPPGSFMRGDILVFFWEKLHGSCHRGESVDTVWGEMTVLCHRGDPQVSVWKEALPLSRGEPQSLRDRSLRGVCLRGDTLVSFWEETPWSLSEKRHPDLCHRGDTLNTSWRGHSGQAEGKHRELFLKEVVLVILCLGCHGPYLGGDALVSVWRESPCLWEKLLGPLSEGGCPGPCLRGDTLVPFWEGTHKSVSEGKNLFLGGEMPWSFCELPWSLSVRRCSGSSERRCPSMFKVRCPGSFQKGDVLLSVWGELCVSFSERRLTGPWEWTPCCVYGKMLWCLSEERHPGLFLRKVVLVSAWEEKPRFLSEVRHFGLCLKVELWSFSKRNPSGLCQEETLWSFYERRTLVSVSGEML